MGKIYCSRCDEIVISDFDGYGYICSQCGKYIIGDAND